VIDEYRSTRDASDRGGGCSIPLPVSPTPTGRFPIDTAPRERFPSAGFRRELPEESCFPPWHGIRTIAMHCPPPRKGAGGGRGSGREVGVFQRKPFNRRHRRQGRGMFHPPPRQPLPHGAIPCRYSATGEIFFSWFQAWNSPKNPVFHVARHPNHRHALPAPSEGGGRRRGTRREAGVFQRKPFNRRCMRQGRYPIDTLPERRLLLCRQYEHPHRNPVPARRR